ncbi:MAG: alpha/beta hydrolase [Atopobiaceae bacterium]|nr:alpha/beta hydrolase [Atopobiaceae bacterium]
MIHETINLKDDGRVNVKTFVLDVYRRTQGITRPAVIILPGGGFGRISSSEGEPVALTFNQLGYNAFVLTYSVLDYSEYPNPLDEALQTIAMVREHAEEWQIDPDQIVVMGFSAGANLTGMVATQWHRQENLDRLGLTAEQVKPNACVICYGRGLLAPDNGQTTYIGSAGVEKRGKIATDRTEQLNVAKYVDSNTPPTFLVHTREDKLVSGDQSFVLGKALWDAGVVFESHLFSNGPHGMGVNNRISYPDDIGRYPSFGTWVPLCDMFLRRQLGMAE